MSNEGVILLKKAGEIIPRQAYEVAAKGRNCMGTAFVLDGELCDERNTSGVMEAETFMQFQDAFKAVNILIYMGTHDGDSDDLDVQPYVKLETEGKAELVAFVEGDYSSFQQSGSKRAAEFHYLEKVVDGHMDDFGSSWKKDEEPTVKDFLLYLDEPGRQKSVRTACKGRGVTYLMSIDGDIKKFSINTAGGEYPWGEMSQELGYNQYLKDEEAKAKAKTEEVSSARSKASKFLKKASAETPKEPEKKPEPETPVIQNPPTDTPKTDTAMNTGKIMARPIQGLTNSQKKEWYEKACGTCPNNNSPGGGWKKGEYVACAPEKLLTLLAQTDFKDKLGEAYVIKMKKEDPKHIPKSEDVRIIPTNQLKDFNEKFLKHKDIAEVMKGVQGVPSPEHLKALEEKYPSFYQKTGLQLAQTLNWPHHKVVELCSQYPHLAATLMFDLRTSYAKYLNETGDGSAPAQPEVEEKAPPAKASKFMRKAS